MDNQVNMQETGLDKTLNMFFSVGVVVAVIGIGGYYYLKKKYGDKFTNLFKTTT